MNFSRMPLWVKLWGSFGKRLLDVIVHGVDNAQIYEGFKFGDTFDSTYDSIVSSEKENDSSTRKKLKSDALRCYLRWGFTPRDYFLFGFHDKNTATALRKTFVSDYYKDYALFSKEGPEKYAELFDKTRFLNRIDNQFLGNKGDYLFVDQTITEFVFVEFAVRVKDLFIKPNSSSYGNGAMCSLIQNEEDARTLFKKLMAENTDWLVERKIIQSDELARWNVSSVNTIRINTFLTDRGFFVLAPFLRTGRAGAIVDNGGKGGILALVDEKTGRICTDGRDEHGNTYVVHPDSSVQYKGETIPDWEDLIKLSEMIHKECMPDHIYISWDFAHTSNGWKVIEGNWGQFIAQQSTSKKGYKLEFDEFMKGHALNSKKTSYE